MLHGSSLDEKYLDHNCIDTEPLCFESDIVSENQTANCLQHRPVILITSTLRRYARIVCLAGLWCDRSPVWPRPGVRLTRVVALARLADAPSVAISFIHGGR